MASFNTIVHPSTKKAHSLSSAEGMKIMYRYISLLDGSHVFNEDDAPNQAGGGSVDAATTACATDVTAPTPCAMEGVDLSRYRTPCLHVASAKNGGGMRHRRKTRRSKKNVSRK
jgi:hypothetical protein